MNRLREKDFRINVSDLAVIIAAIKYLDKTEPEEFDCLMTAAYGTPVEVNPVEGFKEIGLL
jgi:hypothetical protein